MQTQNAFGRALDLKRRYHYSYIALFEPFIGPQSIEEYKRRIRIEYTTVNCFGKIWVFWEADWKGKIVSDSIQ